MSLSSFKYTNKQFTPHRPGSIQSGTFTAAGPGGNPSEKHKSPMAGFMTDNSCGRVSPRLMLPVTCSEGGSPRAIQAGMTRATAPAQVQPFLLGVPHVAVPRLHEIWEQNVGTSSANVPTHPIESMLTVPQFAKLPHAPPYVAPPHT